MSITLFEFGSGDPVPVDVGQSSLETAWNLFFDTAQPLIRCALVGNGIPHYELEDCVQEVWLELMDRLGRIESSIQRGSLVGWLWTVTLRCAWRHLRRQARAARPMDPCLLESVGRLHIRRALNGDPSRAMVEGEFRQELVELVAAISDQVGESAHRLVIHYLAQHTPRLNSLAPELKLTTGQLWHHWRKAMTFLRQHLDLDDVSLVLTEDKCIAFNRPTVGDDFAG